MMISNVRGGRYEQTIEVTPLKLNCSLFTYICFLALLVPLLGTQDFVIKD